MSDDRRTAPAAAGFDARQFRSLRHAIAHPLLCLGTLVVTGIIAAVALTVDHFVVREASERAESTLAQVRLAAETMDSRADLQRYVAAVGADRSILALLIYSASADRIVAATQSALIDGSLDRVADPIVRHLARHALSSRDDNMQVERDRVVISEPLLVLDESAADAPPFNAIAVMAQDIGGTRSTVLASALGTGLAMLALALGMLAITYRLLDRRVMSRLITLKARIDDERAGAAVALLPIDRCDEIGALAAALNDAKVTVKNQKRALDQHGVVAIVDARWRLTSCNERFAALFGAERRAVIDRHQRLFEMLECAAAMRPILRRLRSGEVWQGELHTRAAPDECRWLDATIVPCVDAKGHRDSYVLVGTEVTARKRDAVELACARDAALAASRAKGEFLATVSHELRTPLNGILGFAQLLRMTPLDALQSDYLSTLEGSSEQLLRIVSDILECASIDAGRMVVETAPFDPGQATCAAAGMLRESALGKELDLRLRIAADVPERVLGDGERFRQVMKSLIDNAVKFTDAGTVTVSLDFRPAGAVTPAHLRASIEDTGIGIPRDKAALLFQRFSQIDGSSTRRHGGCGLGLAIAKRLVEAMGGSIGYTPVAEGGSVFWFEIPAIDVATSVPAIDAPHCRAAAPEPTPSERSSARASRWSMAG